MILIGCRGNDPDAPRLLKSEGWRYGYRSDGKAYSRPFFIDIKWYDYIWSDHLEACKYWRPAMAMVADYEHCNQKMEMLAQFRDIQSIGARAMICPKFSGAVIDIPKNAIVAISVPSDYAGFLPAPAEVAGRPLHFLGGHPDQIAVLLQTYRKSQIVSFDCSAIFQKAQFGAFWSAKYNTWRYVKHRFATHTLTRMSARTIGRYLNNPPKLRYFKQRSRLRNAGLELQPMLPQIEITKP